LKIAKALSTAAILLSATMALAMPQYPAQPATQPATQNPAAPTKQAGPGAANKSPQPKTQAEYDAFKAASSQTDAAKVEAAATDFAQKFPDSQLRPFLFQQAMGLYQAANNPDKTLEMARAFLKYDPGNAVALLTAAQMLAERTHDNDLDRDDRLAEASANAQSALQHSGELAQPPTMTPEQFAGALAILRGTAHEVIGTVAFKKLDYFTAIKEYNAAAAEEKEHTDAVVWLRLSIAHDKSGDYDTAIVAVQKAIAASEPNSQVRQLAEQEKSRLEKLSSATAKPGSK
jgi:tetratricopeptide (TPR) repeat protein